MGKDLGNYNTILAIVLQDPFSFSQRVPDMNIGSDLKTYQEILTFFGDDKSCYCILAFSPLLKGGKE